MLFKKIFDILINLVISFPRTHADTESGRPFHTSDLLDEQQNRQHIRRSRSLNLNSGQPVHGNGLGLALGQHLHGPLGNGVAGGVPNAPGSNGQPMHGGPLFSSGCAHDGLAVSSDHIWNSRQVSPKRRR